MYYTVTLYGWYLTQETAIHSFLVRDKKIVLYERDGVGIYLLAQSFCYGNF